jgi:hypothetical protein
MTKYKVQLSEYGTVAFRASVEISAKSEEDAVIKAERMMKKGRVVFDEDECECVDGWEHQVENVVET